MYVAWPDKIINVLSGDLTLIQQNPTTIFELDLNWFRLKLKDLEDDELGIPFVDTHTHSPPVDVGGVTIARVVEIINNYTVTFEDGQYAVNLIGANSNVGDRVNVNQVSVRSANSAGLVTSAAIEYGEYGGGVVIDVINGEVGTIYPIGTKRRPSNNVPDTTLIASSRGFKKIFVVGDLTIGAGHNVDNLILEGESHVNTNVIIESTASCMDLTTRMCNISGTLDGGMTIENCMVGNLSYVNGHIHDSGLYGHITLNGNEDAVLYNCHTIDHLSIPNIDMGGAGQDLVISKYAGVISIHNLSGVVNAASITLAGGLVTLDSTVSAGTIIITGVGTVVDGSTGTASVDTDGLVSNPSITKAVWGADSDDITDDSIGEHVWRIKNNRI